MRFNKCKASRAVAYLLSAVMVSQALLSPASMVYANTDSADAVQQEAVQTKDSSHDEGSDTENATKSNGTTASADTATGSDQTGVQADDKAAAASTHAVDKTSARHAVAAQSNNGYNPDAAPIKLGSGSQSNIDAGVYTDKDRTQPLGDKEVAANDTFYGRVKITFQGSERPTYEHPNIAYELPSNIKVADQGPNNLYDDNVLAGTWSIKNGVVYLNYREDYLNKKVDTAHFDFDFQIKDQNKGDGDNTKITFPGTSAEVTINHRDGDVTGSKWSNDGDYNAADQTYTWTIEVNVKSVANDLRITDTAGSNLSFIADSFELVDTSGNKVDGACKATIDGQVATIALGKVEAGTYRIRYKTKISEAAFKKLKNSKVLDGVDNDMSWKWGKNDENSGHLGGKPKPKELKYNMVSKGAASDSTASRIKWTVVLNSGSLKADMGGYEFQDKLDANQRYLSDGFTVTDEHGNQVMTGAIDPTKDGFTFTLPNDAGEKQYTVTYYTELKDASYKKQVKNTAEVTPPDASHGPSGTADGQVGPFDNGHYISKELTDGSKVDKDGTATWTATIDFKAMSADTKADSIRFNDSFQNPTPHCDQMRFDADSVKITYGDTELKKGTDYTVESPSQWYQGNELKIHFMDTETVRNLIGHADAVNVTYRTKAPNTDAGTYTNKATVSADTITKNNTASASYDIKEGSNVKKSGSDAYWDAGYTWGDGTKGAWISSWEVAVNRTGLDQNSWKGNNDLLGKDVVIDDELPAGSELVADSARYWLMKDGYHSEDKKWELPITPSLSNGHAFFTVSTRDVATNGHWTGWVKLTYKTAIKDSGLTAGETEEVRNTASASCGDIKFAGDTATSTIKKNVLEKWGSQGGNDAAVTYTIKVNQGKFNIDASSNMLTLVDTMDANCNFVSGSLRVTDSNTGKEVTEGVSHTLENVAVSGGVATRLTLTVPDQRALTVTYSVMPIGSKDQWIKLNNVCELSGFAHAGVLSGQDFQVRNSSAGTHSNSYGIKLTKSDQTGKNLSGAVFDLWCVDMDASSAGNLKATKIATAKSDANGEVTFGTKGKPLEDCALYYFVETAAPEGYEITFKNPTYVMIKGSDANGYASAFKRATELGVTPSASRSFNVYDNKVEHPNKETVSVPVEKKWNGREAEKVEFQLVANGKDVAGKTLTLTKDNGWKGSFKDLPKKDDNGQEITYTVEEINVPDGFASTSKVENGTWVFTNTYNKVAPVSTKLSVKKLVNGGSKIAANKEFSFSLYRAGDKDEPQGDAIDTVAVKPGQTATFGKNLTFEKAGIYQYVIVETGELGEGWTKADSVTATVEVIAAKDGTLSAKLVAYSKSDKDSKGRDVALFDNTYEANGTATVAVQKTVNGKTPADNATFDFELTPLDKAPMPDDAESLAVTTKGGEPASFSALSYTLADAGKTYRYLIHETSDATDGWTNAGDVIAKVTVGTDRGNGKLGAATVEYVSASDEGKDAANAEGTAALFNNIYNRKEAEGAFQLSLAKKVNGDAPLAGESFEFSAKLEAGDAEAAPTFANVKTDSNGSATFDLAKLSSKNAGKTYVYRIHEEGDLTGGNGTWAKAADVLATVAVSDHADKDGKLDAKVTYRKDENGAKSYEGTAQFDNTFTPAAVTVPIKVKKVSVNGKTDVKANETYTFGLYKKGKDGDVDGAAIATVSGKLGDELIFTSDALAFTKPGTHEYLIREETHNGEKGWDAVADVPVTVHVDARGGNDSSARDLVATVSYDEDGKGDCASFADTYTASGSATLAVSKIVNGGKDQAEGETFDFVLKDSNGKELSRASASAGETATFKTIDYTLADAGKTFTYTISEIGHDTGRWFKAGDATATVKVSDNNDGTLKTEVSYSNAKQDGTAALFDNTHAAPAKAELKVSKTVNGAKEDAAKETFAFELTGKDGAPMPKSSEATVEGTGIGSFGTISYDKPGTYEYTIHETSDLGAGWKSAQDVTAKVTVVRDEDSKTLKVTKVEYSNATEDGTAAAFDNTYAAKGTEVSFSATKVLKGADLKAGEFTFQLKDSEGKVLQTAKNDKDGNVSFDPISYEASDLDGRGSSRDFEYTISEVVPEDAVDGVKDGVTYDMTEHKVKVRVSDDGKAGQLEATVAYDGDTKTPTFTNTYKPKEHTPHGDTPHGDTPKDETPKDDTPKSGKPASKQSTGIGSMPATGDATMPVVSAIATAGLCALATGLRLMRRKRG